MPSIGRLDRRILFQTKTTVISTSGDIGKPTYATLTTVWASRVDMKGKEKFEQGTLIEHADIKYTVRYNSTLEDTTLRIKDIDSGDFYDIYSINRMGRDRFLTIMCKLKEAKMT